jgi:hypothetical protein
MGVILGVGLGGSAADAAEQSSGTQPSDTGDSIIETTAQHFKTEISSLFHDGMQGLSTASGEKGSRFLNGHNHSPSNTSDEAKPENQNANDKGEAAKTIADFLSSFLHRI